MSKVTPTQRTLAYLRKLGYTAAVVERWNQHAFIRQDLFGFIDIIAIGNGKVLGVQCTSTSGHAAHRDKIVANEHAPKWLSSGAGIMLVSWRKLKLKRGGKAMRWEPLVEHIESWHFPQWPSGEVGTTP